MSEVPWYLQYVKEILGIIATIVTIIVAVIKLKSKKEGKSKKKELEVARWVINERINLDKSSYQDYELKRGSVTSVEISAEDPVDVLILDEENFDKFKRGLRTTYTRLIKEGVTKTTFDYKVPKSIKCYLVINNSGRISATVDVKLKYG